ncbi:MAG: ATP-binding protein [Lachnospiraceae bacterium]
MILFQLGCLCISLAVIQQYITSNVSSHSHRLLPLVIGLFALYDFYGVVSFISGETAVFQYLEDLLLIQILYLLFFYVLDVLKIKLPKIVTGVLFLSLIFTDIYIFRYYGQIEIYKNLIRGYIFLMIGLIILVGTYSFFQHSRSKKDVHIAKALYAVLIILAIGVLLHLFVEQTERTAIQVAVAIACLLISYLLKTGKILDTETLIHQKLYANTNIPIMMFDADFYYISANKKAWDLLKDHFLPGMNEKRHSIYAHKVYLLSKEEHMETEFCEDGKYYSCRLTPIMSEKELIGYVLTMSNITKQKLETKNMAEQKEEAERQTILKSQFLARMSHDLRSPLHAILNISEILSTKAEMSAHNRSLAKHIHSSGKNLLELVNSILEYSKLEAGKLELTEKSYEFDTMIRELVRMTVANIESKRIEVSFKFSTDYYRMLIGDLLRVQEIFQNLLSNAVKFTENGEIRCEISMEKQEERALVKVCLTDSGCGIEPDRLPYLFDEYFSDAQKRYLEGTGLGLNIVKQLLRMMDGDIQAESDGKKGSKFTFWFYQGIAEEILLPPVVFDRYTISTEMNTSIQRTQPDWIFPKAKILVADDMQVNLQIFKEITKPWKFELDMVENGLQAIERIRLGKYDLIFLDMLMPGMTGVETAKVIHQECDTPLILLSANTLDDTIEECRSGAFVECISKPIFVPELKKAFEKYLPEDLREEPEKADREIVQYEDRVFDTRTVRTFVREIESLSEAISGYAQDKDLEMFRIKVHGIKGVSKQIGLMEIGEIAEILEMAAKTDNRQYIQSHIDGFIEALKDSVSDIKEAYPSVFQTSKEEERDAEIQDVGISDIEIPIEVIMRLADGFEQCNLTEIEDVLEELDRMHLTKDEQELLELVKKAAEELEYEEGSLLIKKYMDSHK